MTGAKRHGAPMDTKVSRLLLDWESRAVVASVDPTVTEFERGQLDGIVTTVKLLGEHGLTLSGAEVDDLWTASMGARP